MATTTRRRRGSTGPGLFEGPARPAGTRYAEPPRAWPTGWLCTFCGTDASLRLQNRGESSYDYDRYVQRVHPFRACYERATGRVLPPLQEGVEAVFAAIDEGRLRGQSATRAIQQAMSEHLARQRARDTSADGATGG